MRKLKLIIIAAIVSILSQVANATVTITPPEKPEGIVTELVPGESYYLFNLGKEQFVNRHTDSPDYTGWSDTPYAFRLDESSDGYYALWQGSSYLGGYNEVRWAYSTSNTDYYVRLDIQKNNDDSYKIREVGPDYLWGYYNGWGSVYSRYSTSSTEENVSWIFIKADADVNETLRCYYKNKLYNAIVNADTKGYDIEYYEGIYNDETKTNDELIELYNAFKLSETNSYLFPDWSDYPILITSLGDWYGNNGGNSEYLYKSIYKEITTTNTLKTSVYVDQPSTMSFILDCSYRYVNNPTMPFQVFVDGKLVYDYKGETDYHEIDTYFYYVLHGSYTNGDYIPYSRNYRYRLEPYNYDYRYQKYNRHFINLEPGHHLIDIATPAYDETDYTAYFREIGVEKVPTIEVSLAKVGSLGDEVLRAMDNNPLILEPNIRNTRRLKISGKMGDADFDEIYNMTELYSLDLTDAEITEIKTGQLSQYYHNSLNSLHELKLPKNLKTIGQEALYATYVDYIDIPETVDSIGDFAFANSRLREANIPNVTRIGHNAFRGCTMLNKVVMKNVEWMGINAFAECYNLKDIVLEGNLTTIPERAFYCCEQMSLNKIPETVTSIEQYGFSFKANENATFSLPSALTAIGAHALENAYSLQGDIPAGVTSIGENAFSYAWYKSNEGTVNLPANSTFGNTTFQGAGMKNIVVPQEYYNFDATKMFANCDSLKSIKFMSPTKVSVPTDFVDGLTKKNIKVYVPDYLRTTYMRDSYWMDFTIVGFSTTEMDSIVIRQDLALSQHDRFLGTPDLTVDKGVTFELEGVAGMDVKNMILNSDLEANSFAQIVSGTDQVTVEGLTSNRLYTKANKWYFLSLPFDCNLSQTVNENGGKYAIRYYDGASRAEESDITYSYPESAHDYANNLRTDTEGNLQRFSYPGASKLKIIFNANTNTESWSDYIYIKDASGQSYSYTGNIGAREVILSGDYFDIWIESNSNDVAYGYSIDEIYADDVLLPKRDSNNSNWKNYDCTKDVIPAGTGFIFMTSQDSWTRFYSADNGTKNRIFEDSENENNEFHYELQKHPSENAANRGWNLVGNPYPNYYNNHKLSFAAPITLWDGTTYKAYSLRDDDIAIKPNQAVFVQCPEDVAEISWPAAGRQTTSVITDQANARPRTTADSRQIIDLALTNGTFTDDTRVVINPKASLNYEVGCDAGKFMSMDNAVQQLYTMDANQNSYAINERPLAEGSVALGTYFPTEGTYTISLKRNQAQTVLLTDRETGFTHDLTADDYTFTAKAGTDNARFVITITATETDGIENIENAKSAKDSYYNIAGQRISSANAKGITIVNGKKVAP